MNCCSGICWFTQKVLEEHQAHLDTEVNQLQLVLLRQLPCLQQHQAQLACHMPQPCDLHCNGRFLTVTIVGHTNSSVLQKVNNMASSTTMGCLHEAAGRQQDSQLLSTA